MRKPTKNRVGGLEQYASKGSLVFAGSLIVVSIALNNSGFAKLIDAYSEAIIADIKNKQQCNTNLDNTVKKLVNDVELLKIDSHKKK